MYQGQLRDFARYLFLRMKDCGEDLLVDISEILFNELAFFKLMQELDGYVLQIFVHLQRLNIQGRLQKHSLAIVYRNQWLNWFP